MHLVLLHALPFDGRMWAEQMDLLPRATIAPDLYGLGRSIEEWARAIVDRTDGEQLIVVGASMGGSCALEIAALAPARVAAVVLAEAKAGHRPEPEFRDEVVRTLQADGMAGAWQKYWAQLIGRATDLMIVEAARTLAFDQDIDDVVRGVRAFHSRRDLSEFARVWTKPLVVISGDQNRPERFAQLARDASDGEFHCVADCGHYVNLEQPSQFAAIVRGVIDRVTT
ncbi:MAG: alpha/beta hydrolase [Acidimicrobiales bacterium]